jgi:TonB family protein
VAGYSFISARLAKAISVAIAAAIVSATSGAATEQRATSPRLREAHLPAKMPPLALGGGEVVLELTVDASGRVAAAGVVRTTPPYTELLLKSIASWRFAPAMTVIDGHLTAVDAPVLVVAVFRPPTLYAGPAPGEPPKTLRAPSVRLPRVRTVTMPAYPPKAVGDGFVLIEIEMDAHGQPQKHRVVSPPSGFDRAALDAVRAWQFDPPQRPEGPEPVFVYALVGFRAPVVVPTRPPG